MENFQFALCQLMLFLASKDQAEKIAKAFLVAVTLTPFTEGFRPC